MRGIKSIVFCWVALLSAEALACSCAMPQFHPGQLFEESEAVFVGEIVGETVVVVKSYKGLKKGDTFPIEKRDSMCAAGYVNGKKYLLYEQTKPTDSWRVPHLCSSRLFLVSAAPKDPSAFLKTNHKDWVVDKPIKRKPKIGKQEPTPKKVEEVKPTTKVAPKEAVKPVAEKPTVKSGGCATANGDASFLFLFMAMWFFSRRIYSRRCGT